jgi:hypothetical protein
LTLQNGIRTFFEKLIDTDRKIFTELKSTIIEQQDNMINSLDTLKTQVHHYFGEESLRGQPRSETRLSQIRERNNLKHFVKDCSKEKKELVGELQKTFSDTFQNNE